MPKRAKILYLITKSNWGGAQKYVFDLATALNPKEYEPIVVLGSPHPDEQASGILLQKLREANIRVVEVPEMQKDISFGKEWVIFWKIFSIIRIEKPRVIHLNSSKAAGLGALAARLFSLISITHNLQPRIIFTVHGWPFLEETRGRSRSLMKFFSWLTAMLSHHIIVISKNNFEIGCKMPFLKNKLKLIYNGIKPPVFLGRGNAREKLRAHIAKFDVPPDETAIWVGTIAEYTDNKGLSYLINALSKITKTRPDLEIFGFLVGEGKERKQLEEIIKREKLENKIILTGFIPNASELLPAFDIFCLPSIKEGHPYTLLEAGLAARASIGSNISGIADTIDNGSGILVEPKNATELARAIEILAADPGKKEEFGKNLYQKISREFNFEQMFSKTLALY